MHEEESRTPSIEEVLAYLDEQVERDSSLLKRAPIITDSHKDITEYIEARLNAYIEVKSYIKRGKSG